MRPTKLIPPPVEIQHPVLGHRQVPGQKALVDLDSAVMGAVVADVEGKGEVGGWKKSVKVCEGCL